MCEWKYLFTSVIHNGLRKKHVNINKCPQNEYYSDVHKGVLWQISGLSYKEVTATGPLLRPVTVVVSFFSYIISIYQIIFFEFKI